MKKVYISIAFLLMVVSLYSQYNPGFEKLKLLRARGYLEICSDQLQTGVFKDIESFTFNNSFIDSIKVFELNSSGMPKPLVFLKFELTYPGHRDAKSYVLCFNDSDETIFRLKGFSRNDYYLFFLLLEDYGIKISKRRFNADKIHVDEVDLRCLANAFIIDRKSKMNRLHSSERAKTGCFEYNFQPVIVY